MSDCSSDLLSYFEVKNEPGISRKYAKVPFFNVSASTIVLANTIYQ